MTLIFLIHSAAIPSSISSDNCHGGIFVIDFLLQQRRQRIMASTELAARKHDCACNRRYSLLTTLALIPLLLLVRPPPPPPGRLLSSFFRVFCFCVSQKKRKYQESPIAVTGFLLLLPKFSSFFLFRKIEAIKKV